MSIIALGLFLRLYRLEELMPFIGDQGWFYLSARDMILTGKVPLVGITSSHTWLHQGPLWTYFLGVTLWFSNFNPLSGGYLTVFLDLAAILIVYKICSVMFSKSLGIIATILYSVSPLIVFNSRFPYHTSPITLFTFLLIFFLYKWIEGKNIYFPLAVFTLGVLYNLELSIFPLWFAVIAILIYGFCKKKAFVKNLFKKKISLFTLLAFIPMLPIFIYDFTHSFYQTVGFAVWITYKSLNFFINSNEISFFNNEASMLGFLHYNIQKLLFFYNGKIAIVLFFASLFSFSYSLYKMFKNKSYKNAYLIVVYIEEYNLIGKGWLTDFKSYTMNYEYLAWWMGNNPVKDKRTVKIYVTEGSNKIEIQRSTDSL